MDIRADEQNGFAVQPQQPEGQGQAMPEDVQNQQVTSGENISDSEVPPKPIDYEKAYKNLEKDYTRKSQKLKEIEGWAKFQELTGITAEQALRQLEAYQQQYGVQPTVQPQAYQQPAQPYAHQVPNYYAAPNPELEALRNEMAQLKRERQMAELRQKFPNFDEYYADTVAIADEYNLDLETAFGRVLVQNWDAFTSQMKQQAVDNIRAKGAKALEPSSAPSPVESTVELTPEEKEAARLMGIPEEEYAKMKGADVTI